MECDLLSQSFMDTQFTCAIYTYCSIGKYRGMYNELNTEALFLLEHN